MDFLTPLAGLKAAIDMLDSVRKAGRALDQATLKAELASVVSNLADIRMALVDAKDEARVKDEEIARLKGEFETRKGLIEKWDFAYFPSKTDPTVASGWPICPRCEQMDGRLVRLVAAQIGRGGKCAVCKETYPHANHF